ncbi:uncharacterized protein LOC123542112 [Mercenaria mercenaria]|uniref:uncharacterized protein LOC123542112 n=1 Tax=Mercenaria mercenaria TaxID=6596 RepID=UPI00234F935C|nr:uncharacterized protein LOC123542112 [Mercenaria mercenaria]
MWRYCIVVANLFGVVLGWHLVMKVPQGDLGGATSVYDLWTSNMTLNPDAENVMNIQPGIPYKSADTLNWEKKDISLVKIAFYTGGDEMAYIVFGAAGQSYNHSDWPIFSEATNITSWFDCSRILHSTFSSQFPGSVPDFCSIHSVSTLDHSFSIMSMPIESSSDCANMTGWFTVLEPGSSNSAIQCQWQPSGSPPHFMFSSGNGSVLFSEAVSADVFAVYVDDCIDKKVCHSPACWQDPHGNCFCNGFKCTEACSHLPCSEGTKCVTNPKNESNYTCECLYGYVGNRCKVTADTDGLTAAAIAGIVIAILLLIGLVTIAIWYYCRWRHKDDELKQEMTQRAVSAKNFVRRSVHRLSGRQYQFQRRHLKEEKPSPTITVKGKSEQLSPDSSIVFGEVNPAFDTEEPTTPQPTPPVDRRYTEFPTRHVPQLPVSVSVTEIQLHEKQQQESKPSVPQSGPKGYENLPFPQSEVRSRRESPHNFDVYDRASTVGSFEKASTMSEISDATSTSGYSDYTGDAPANLPPSEMISKDVLRHGHHRHKVRSRPRSRASTADPPKVIVAPETPEGQINYAMERSRLSISSLSSMSSEATHKSDSTQRSGELTKSDVLRARYEHMAGHGEPAGRFSRFDHLTRGEGPSYLDIKRQLDADMSRREARERKLQFEQENEAKYEAEKVKKHRMRQVESLDSGIDAENTTGDRNSDGRIQIVRARSADQLDRNMTVSFSSKEATV